MLSKLQGLAIELIIGCVLLGGAYWWGRQSVPQEVTKTVEHTQIEYRDRIVTVTKTVQPDGTTTETTKTEEVAQDTRSDSGTTSIQASSTLPNYSLGAGMVWNPEHQFEFSKDYVSNNYYVGAGYRVAGPVWVNGEYKPGANSEVRLGFSVSLD